MDLVGVAGTLVYAIARATLVALQTGPVNGTGGSTTNGTNTTTDETNTTNASNATNVSAPEQIDEGTQRTVGFLGDLWPDWLPAIPLWLVRLLLALVVLLVAWYLSKLVVRLLSRRDAHPCSSNARPGSDRRTRG